MFKNFLKNKPRIANITCLSSDEINPHNFKTVKIDALKTSKIHH